MNEYKKIYLFGFMTIVFLGALTLCPPCSSTKTHDKLEITLIKFDNIQEIEALEEFLSNPEIAIKIIDRLQRIKEHRINRFKALEKDIETQIFLQNNYFVAVAKKESQIYGAALSFKAEDALWLDTIVIYKEFQNQGIEESFLQLIYEKSHLSTILRYENSYNKHLYELLQQMHFFPKRHLSCMEKSANDFSSYPKKQISQEFTIHFMDKNNQTEIDTFFKVFDYEEIKEILEEFDENYAKREFKYPEADAFYAKDTQGNPVGTILYYENKDNNSYNIQLLGVPKEYQRQGIAKALIKAVQNQALKNGIKTLEIGALVNNSKALNCYKSIGFVEQYQRTLFQKNFTE